MKDNQYIIRFNRFGDDETGTILAYCNDENREEKINELFKAGTIVHGDKLIFIPLDDTYIKRVSFLRSMFRFPLDFIDNIYRWILK
jgi:hypothetical protein